MLTKVTDPVTRRNAAVNVVAKAAALHPPLIAAVSLTAEQIALPPRMSVSCGGVHILPSKTAFGWALTDTLACQNIAFQLIAN